MTDYGTRIVDAGGSFHDLATNAFDTLSKLHYTDKTFQEEFDSLKVRALKEVGIELDGDLTVENMTRAVLQQVGPQALKFGIDTLAGAVINKLGDLEGPMGMLVSEALSIAVNEFSQVFTGHQKFKPGQWVLLHLDQKS